MNEIVSCYFPWSRNDRLDVLYACNYFTCPMLYNLVAACMSWFYLLSVSAVFSCVLATKDSTTTLATTTSTTSTEEMF